MEGGEIEMTLEQAAATLSEMYRKPPAGRKAAHVTQPMLTAVAHGSVRLRSDHDEQAAVVARAPLLDAVHGPHIHALVEAARGEDVV